jgi:hypothetical protein
MVTWEEHIMKWYCPHLPLVWHSHPTSEKNSKSNSQFCEGDKAEYLFYSKNKQCRLKYIEQKKNISHYLCIKYINNDCISFYQIISFTFKSGTSILHVLEDKYILMLNRNMMQTLRDYISNLSQNYPKYIGKYHII